MLSIRCSYFDTSTRVSIQKKVSEWYLLEWVPPPVFCDWGSYGICSGCHK